jgi:hypothetical protein
LGELELAISPFAKDKFENESLAHPAGRSYWFLELEPPTVILSEVGGRYPDEFVSKLAPQGQLCGLPDCGLYIP